MIHDRETWVVRRTFLELRSHVPKLRRSASEPPSLVDKHGDYGPDADTWVGWSPATSLQPSCGLEEKPFIIEDATTLVCYSGDTFPKTTDTNGHSTGTTQFCGGYRDIGDAHGDFYGYPHVPIVPVMVAECDEAEVLLAQNGCVRRCYLFCTPLAWAPTTSFSCVSESPVGHELFHHLPSGSSTREQIHEDTWSSGTKMYWQIQNFKDRVLHYNGNLSRRFELCGYVCQFMVQVTGVDQEDKTGKSKPRAHLTKALQRGPVCVSMQLKIPQEVGQVQYRKLIGDYESGVLWFDFSTRTLDWPCAVHSKVTDLTVGMELLPWC